MKFDVVGMGELLIDFTPSGLSGAGNQLFERNPGGGVANMLAAVAKLGGRGAFIGKVGRDVFGNYLKGVLETNAIDASGLRFCDDTPTTLAFVHLSADGDRSFSFYRNPGADTRLREDEVDYGLIDEARIFHFGSLSMTDEPSRTATLKAAAHARKSGSIISYDPNWRPPLWRSDAEAKAGMEAGLQFADILKISDTELEFLTGTADLDAGSKMLMERGIKLVLVTLGAKGSYFRHPGGTGHLFTYDTRVIDTTGAGDAFLGSMLYQLSRCPAALDDIETGEISGMVDFSNAVGALCASGKGGMPSMPSMDNVLMCMKNIPKLIR